MAGQSKLETITEAIKNSDRAAIHKTIIVTDPPNHSTSELVLVYTYPKAQGIYTIDGLQQFLDEMDFGVQPYRVRRFKPREGKPGTFTMGCALFKEETGRERVFVAKDFLGGEDAARKEWGYGDSNTQKGSRLYIRTRTTGVFVFPDEHYLEDRMSVGVRVIPRAGLQPGTAVIDEKLIGRYRPGYYDGARGTLRELSDIVHNAPMPSSRKS